MSITIKYNTEENPTEVGVYACRIPSELFDGFHEDIFLLWHDNKWNRLRSDQKYRGEVTGWIGPLQRKL